jgi:hypothetical protein
MLEIMQMIEDGATDNEIRIAFPTQFMRYINAITRARQVITETTFQNTFPFYQNSI